MARVSSSKVDGWGLGKCQPNRLAFDRRWVLIPLWFTLLALLCGLGNWQLQRAAQKRAWLAQQSGQPLLNPSSTEIDRALARQLWLPVRLSVQWLSGSMMLDNRTSQGRVGYEVLKPARLADGSVVLVNLGWVAAAPRRDMQPHPVLPRGKAVLSGVVGKPVNTFTLSSQEDPSRWRVQRLNTEVLGRRFGVALHPWVVWLQQAVSSDIEARLPLNQQMPPARHLAYAAQWFGLAVVLLIIGVRLLWRRRRSDET